MAVVSIANAKLLKLPDKLTAFTGSGVDFNLILASLLQQPDRYVAPPPGLPERAGNERDYSAHSSRQERCGRVGGERERYQAAAAGRRPETGQAGAAAKADRGTAPAETRGRPDSGAGATCAASDPVAGDLRPGTAAAEAKNAAVMAEIDGVSPGDGRAAGKLQSELAGRTVKNDGLTAGGGQDFAKEAEAGSGKGAATALKAGDSLETAARNMRPGAGMGPDVRGELPADLQAATGAGGESGQTVARASEGQPQGGRSWAGQGQIQINESSSNAFAGTGTADSGADRGLAGQQQAAGLQAKAFVPAAATAGYTAGQGLQQGGINGAAASNGAAAGSQIVFSTAFNRAGDSLPVNNRPQIMAAILETARLARLGSQRELELQLRPENLGNLKIKAALLGSSLTLQLLVESSEVARLLQAMLPEMRQAVAEQGLRLEHIELQLQGGADSNEGLDYSGSRNEYRPDRNWQQQAGKPWQGELTGTPLVERLYRCDYLA